MALKRRKILKQMIDLGHGTTTVPADSGGSLTGDLVGIHSFLGSGVISVDSMSGADLGEKIANAITVLPSTGGTVDASGYVGTQTISSAITVAKPVVLLLGQATITCATTGFTVSSSLTVRGRGKNVTTIQTSHASNPIFNVAAGNAGASTGAFILNHVTLDSTVTRTSGAYVALTGPGGSTTNAHSIIEFNRFNNAYIGIDAGIVEAARITNNDFTGSRYRAIRWNNTANTDQGEIAIMNNVFSDDAVSSDTAGIEIQSGSAFRIIGNKMFEHRYHILLNPSDGALVAEVHIVGNVLDSPRTGGIYFTGTGTGSSAVVLISSNRFANSTATGNLIESATGAVHVAQANIIGNEFDLRGATGIKLGNSSAGETLISGNRLYEISGTGATGINIGTGLSEVNLGINQVLATTNYTISSTLRGIYLQEKMAFGIDPGVSLSEQLTIPNAQYYSTRAAAGTAKKLIGQDGSDVVRIAQSDQQSVQFGSSGTTGPNLAIANSKYYRTYESTGVTLKRLIGQDSSDNVQIAPDSQAVVIQGQLTLGSVTLTSASTSTSFTNGGGTAMPTNIEKMLTISINGTSYKIPLVLP